MKWKKILSLLLCLMLLAAFALHAGAEFGDFAGDSDYGDSDYDSDYGDSDYDYGDSDYDDDDDDDGYGSDSDSGSSGGSSGFTVLALAIVVVYLVVSAFRSSKGKGGKTTKRSVMPGAQATLQSQLRPMGEYEALDANFDAGDLVQKLSNWYVQMQNCWSDGDIEPVRPFFSDAYWQQMNRQLQAMRQQGRVDHTERIAVLGVTLRGFYQSGGEDHIIAELRTRIVSYVTDKAGTLVSGSRTAEKFMTYEWDLTRPSGTQTQEADVLQTVRCPNCGATLSINESAKCPYCDSVITLTQHGWVIASIKGISQRTV